MLGEMGGQAEEGKVRMPCGLCATSVLALPSLTPARGSLGTDRDGLSCHVQCRKSPETRHSSSICFWPHVLPEDIAGTRSCSLIPLEDLHQGHTVSTLYYQPCSYWWPGDTFGLSIQECFFSAGEVDHFMTEFLGSNSHWYLWGLPPSTAVVALTSYFSHHPVSP